MEYPVILRRRQAINTVEKKAGVSIVLIVSIIFK